MTDRLPFLRLSTRSAAMDAKEYVRRFRDRERFFGLCRQCPSFGRQYGCPPFGSDPVDGCPSDGIVTTYLTCIEPEVPQGETLPLSLAEPVMAYARSQVEPELLKRERRYGGRAFIGVGRCTRCGEQPCARADGAPCRFPDLVRPSLEAAGFDVGAIVGEIFGETLQWGSDGMLPSRLHLVTALWHPRR